MGLHVNKCVKCGEQLPAINWTHQVETATVEGITFTGGEMVALCQRCGYQWTVAALDNGGR